MLAHVSHVPSYSEKCIVLLYVFFLAKEELPCQASSQGLRACWPGLRKSQTFFCFKVTHGIWTYFYYTLERGGAAFRDMVFSILNLYLMCPQLTSQEKSEKLCQESEKCHSDKHKDMGLKKALIYFRSLRRGLISYIFQSINLV